MVCAGVLDRIIKEDEMSALFICLMALAGGIENSMLWGVWDITAQNGRAVKADSSVEICLDLRTNGKGYQFTKVEHGKKYSQPFEWSVAGDTLSLTYKAGEVARYKFEMMSGNRNRLRLMSGQNDLQFKRRLK
jgi:hypothetical protein